MNRERLKGHLDLLLLAVVSDGPAHGYGVAAVIAMGFVAVLQRTLLAPAQLVD